MKKLKIFGILLVGYTVGEIITMYRLEPKTMSFGEFLKEFADTNKSEFKKAVHAGDLAVTNPSKSKAEFAKIVFPNRSM